MYEKLENYNNIDVCNNDLKELEDEDREICLYNDKKFWNQLYLCCNLDRYSIVLVKKKQKDDACQSENFVFKKLIFRFDYSSITLNKANLRYSDLFSCLNLQLKQIFKIYLENYTKRVE